MSVIEKQSAGDPIPDTEVFGRVESQVRSYCRDYGVIFESATGSTITDTGGRSYIDFLAGCSALNYGHNDPDMQQALIQHLGSNALTHGLDLYTVAKRAFLEAFERTILAPRGMDHRVQFTGPTGTNAVEAALKLARKTTGRTNVIAFTNGFHGVSLGALAATGNRFHRIGPSMPLAGVTRALYDGYLGPDLDTTEILAALLDDPSSGVDAPAAFLVECVQGEGGLNAASTEWMRRLDALARRHGAVLIIDDIQAGCGRTGTFFSFEQMGIRPDIVTLSKSISGFGLPMALVLLRPELDVWRPAEHNGTFRGNAMAFVTARVAIEKFWSDEALATKVNADAATVTAALSTVADRIPGARLKGRRDVPGRRRGRRRPRRHHQPPGVRARPDHRDLGITGPGGEGPGPPDDAGRPAPGWPGHRRPGNDRRARRHLVRGRAMTAVVATSAAVAGLLVGALVGWLLARRRPAPDHAPESAPTPSNVQVHDETEPEPSTDVDTPIVSARDVAKSYRTSELVVPALRGVDIDIAAGEFLAVVGPSGNGKSTLLNCLSGIDSIDGGQVLVDGLDIHRLSARRRAAHRAARMGFVFQSFNLITVLTAVENVELPLLAAGARSSEARRRAEELLGRVGLAARSHHRPGELSGGEQQRVAVARALVTEPAVIWADEPTGNLDSTSASAVIDLFGEVNAAGQTVVMVTHDPTMAARADRIVEVRDGRIVADRPAELRTGASTHQPSPDAADVVLGSIGLGGHGCS